MADVFVFHYFLPFRYWNSRGRRQKFFGDFKDARYGQRIHWFVVALWIPWHFFFWSFSRNYVDLNKILKSMKTASICLFWMSDIWKNWFKWQIYSLLKKFTQKTCIISSFMLIYVNLFRVENYKQKLFLEEYLTIELILNWIWLLL